MVFSPPKRIIRLKKELAKELANGIDSVFGDDDDGDEDQYQDPLVLKRQFDTQQNQADDEQEDEDEMKD